MLIWLNRYMANFDYRTCVVKSHNPIWPLLYPMESGIWRAVTSVPSRVYRLRPPPTWPVYMGSTVDNWSSHQVTRPSQQPWMLCAIYVNTFHTVSGKSIGIPVIGNIFWLLNDRPLPRRGTRVWLSQPVIDQLETAKVISHRYVMRYTRRCWWNRLWCSCWPHWTTFIPYTRAPPSIPYKILLIHVY